MDQMTFILMSCPVTGIPATRDCRCPNCRPDIHLACADVTRCVPGTPIYRSTTTAALPIIWR
jgi:hypothetical protein